MIVLIDNYDSFTYNLYQLLAQYAHVEVIRNDQVTVADLAALRPDAIVLSPGPGRPEDAGICIDVIRQLYKEIPILGICLGHQAIVQAFGGGVVRAGVIKHGKTSSLYHSGTSLFQYMSQPSKVMRYHSLVADRATLPETLEVLATAMDDGEIMAVRHHYYPVFGLQFHPESIATEEGSKLIQQFIKEVAKDERVLAEVN